MLYQRNINNLIFVSDEHQQFYKNHADIVNCGNDYAALVYTLGINHLCRKHFNQLYDQNRKRIIPDGLTEWWQTGASVKITRLAFNLFTGQVAPGDDPANYAPMELFSGLDSIQYNGVILALKYFVVDME
jgi:hypothetical protein